MKKLFLIPLAFAALASCSQHEVVDNGATTGETVTSYLAVNLVSANGGTRADGDYGTFETGTTQENSITDISFYFFNASGKAVSIYGSEQKNHYDYTVTTGKEDVDDGSDMNNVESIRNAVLVLNTKDASGEGEVIDNIASVVAIVNASEVTTLTGDMVDLDELNGLIADFTPRAYTEEDKYGHFVMSNAVYSDGTNAVDAVSITNNIFTAADAALANPVTIFVERVVAKVCVTIDNSMQKTTTAKGDIYELATEEEVPVEGEGGQDSEKEQKKVYVKLLGWNVTAKADKSHLVKDIYPTWSDNLFTTDLTQPWNDPTWHRSYWAVNPSSNPLDEDYMSYVYGKFGSWEDEGTQDNVKFEGTDAGAISDFVTGSVYVQENAALLENRTTTGKEFSDEAEDFDETTKKDDNTKVIVAAQLVDESGNPLEVAEYAFNRYTVADLKDFFAKSAQLYDESGNALSADDIEFKTVSAVDNEGEVDHSVAGRYNVYAQLTADAEQKTWYDIAELDGDHDDEHKVETDDVNAKLKNFGKARVWNNGYTYYTVKIAHIASVQEHVTGSAGKYGVVRNHVYAVNIKSISGLGTPVFDPTEEIIPENPEDEFSFCAAEIRVLSWRVVSQDVDLTW